MITYAQEDEALGTGAGDIWAVSRLLPNKHCRKEGTGSMFNLECQNDI